MPKKTTEEMKDLFKTSFTTVKGNRTSGWEAEDSERVVMSLISGMTDKDGKEIKLTPERTGKIQAALAITSKRIAKLIKNEMEAAGAVVDEFTEDKILWLADLPKIRNELTEAGILEKSGKGKRSKKKVVDLLK